MSLCVFELISWWALEFVSSWVLEFVCFWVDELSSLWVLEFVSLGIDVFGSCWLFVSLKANALTCTVPPQLKETLKVKTTLHKETDLPRIHTPKTPYNICARVYAREISHCNKATPHVATCKSINYRSEVLSSLAFPASGRHVSEQFV